MYKLSSAHVPRYLVQTLAAMLIVSVTGCGSSESTSSGETAPPNPEPTQPAISANSATPASIDRDALFAYAILAGTGIDNIPSSRVIGNVGLFFATGTAIALSCAELEGVIHAADAAGLGGCGQSTEMASVQTALTRIDQEFAALTDAAPITGADLGNTTLLPGTYSAQTLEISRGDLVLDAQGNANAVWVFQIAADFHVASGRRVILSGGVQARNIHWRVAGSVQLGEYSVVHGNIFANDSIRLLTGAYLEGRAWARQGSVQLASSTIRIPSP